MKRGFIGFLISALLVVVAAAAPVGAWGNSGDHRHQKSYTDKSVKTYIKSETYKGYTLLAPSQSKKTFLIDNKGKVRHTWTSQYNPGMAVYLLEDGNLLRTNLVDPFPFGQNSVGGPGLLGGTGGRVEILDWNSNVVWDYELASEREIHHHDVNVLPNGNILMLAYEAIDRDTAEAAGVDPANVDPVSNDVWSEFIIEVDPDTDQTVWEWHAWDHMVQDYDPTKANYGNVKDNPRLLNANYYKYSHSPNWVHANGLNYNADLDQIMISARFFNEVWIIDHSTTSAEAAAHAGGDSGQGGDLLFRWGNPEAYNAGTEQDRELFLQHNPQWIEDGLPGEDNILIFNNGEAATRPYSTVIEISPDTGSGGDYQLDASGKFTADTEWEYNPPEDKRFFAPIVSGAQRLPNGNTLICNGPAGTFIEVTPQGKTVWEFVNPIFGANRFNPDVQTNMVFRAIKYPASYPAFDGKKLTPKGKISHYR